MKILVSRLYVSDQEKALDFYTKKLGFTKKEDFSNSGYRWLTVTSPEDENGTALLLEAATDPTAKAYQQAQLQQESPAMLFSTGDLAAEYARLTGLGVEFKLPPQDIGPMVIATLYDGCGNLIQINQPVSQ